MKRKFMNLIAIIIEVIAQLLFLTMKGTYRIGLTTKFGSISSYFHANAGGFLIALWYILWGSYFVMCLFSLFSKKQQRDSILHCIIPFVILLTAYPLFVGFVESAPTLEVFYIILLIQAVFSVVKRSRLVSPKPTYNNTAPISSAEEIQKYKDLLDSGAITQEEFDIKKKELLGL